MNTGQVAGLMRRLDRTNRLLETILKLMMHQGGYLRMPKEETAQIVKSLERS